jgi:predicted nucleic acid-binding protein
MENVIVLDTCVLFDFLAGKGKADVSQVERFLLEAKAAVSVVTVFELLRGVESEKHIAQRKELIGLCTVLDLTPPISERAAGIYTYLKKKGSLIHMEDILIAASALHWRYSIMTSNSKDFSRIPGVKLE